MKIKNPIFILLVLFLCHTSGMAQVVHFDSITKKHTGYYTIVGGFMDPEFGYLKKGKKEGFWVHSDEFGSFFILDYYKHNKLKNIGITTYDSTPIRSSVPGNLFRKSFDFVFENGNIQEIHNKKKDIQFLKGRLRVIAIRDKNYRRKAIVKFYNSNREIDSIIRSKLVIESCDDCWEAHEYFVKNGRQRYYNNKGKLTRVEIYRNRELKRTIVKKE